MSTEISSSQSDILPAVMLALLLAVTGFETAFLVLEPHKAAAHPVKVAALFDGRR